QLRHSGGVSAAELSAGQGAFFHRASARNLQCAGLLGERKGGCVMAVLGRLIQPRNPLFWIVVVLQLLSMAFVAIRLDLEPAPLVAWVLRVLAVGNAVLGMAIAWRLLRGAA